MNETMSLLLATTVLALGGLGLYMYKNSDDLVGGDNYNEDEIFGKDDDISLNEDEIEHEPKPKTRGGGKTKRNKKGLGTKRRY
jgi:hypothetical protein